ncbi:hypothetical protein HYH02_000684 [Chlamydomonas schloesseri]|uniref:CASTOR/POLLUX/SYM8 ion channel conserved domain-containing protein n=1 Tax=Chlamydomonas schloesseri TaxID=2026947 RepID=A0A836BCV2_9CHLO|nr:hypothetical protein HYH02_000684 [Chlamydomonas schloesseri]|eukprot:KAG2454852.1 hypothetical protein HYH02_000684 [Chlamydomonas schloesseri]
MVPGQPRLHPFRGLGRRWVRTLSSAADGSSGPAPSSSSSVSSTTTTSNESNAGSINGDSHHGNSSASSAGPGRVESTGPATRPAADAIAALNAQRAAYSAAAAAAVNATMVGSWATAVPVGARPVPQVAWSQATNGINSVRGRPHSLREAWRAWLARVAQLIQYRLMMIFRMPTWGKMLSLIIVGLPIVVVGSVLLRQATNLSWYEAMQYAFYVLQNVPGMDITRFDQVQARVVLIVIHLMSLYTFATMVGLLTEDVRLTVEEIRSGNFPIPARDHTVLLDPTEDPQHLIAVLKQVLAARESRGQGVYAGCIAVLSTQPKDDLDKLIADSLPQSAASIVVTRYGSSMKVTDLERVAAGNARTVLLLTPRRAVGALTPAMQQELSLTALRSLQPQPPPLTSAADINQAAADMAAGRAGRTDHADDHTASTSGGHASSSSSNGGAGVGGSGGMWRWLFGEPGDSMDEHDVRQPEQRQHRGRGRRGRGRGPHRQQRVVVETITAADAGGGAGACQVVDSDPDLDPLQVTYVSSASSAYRVVVQCAVQPGLAAVFDTIFCREQDASLHITPLPLHLAGRTFGDARRQFRYATLCGIVPASGSSSSSSSNNIHSSSSLGSDGTGSEASESASSSDSETEAAGARPASGAAAAAASAPTTGYTAPFNFNLQNVLGFRDNDGSTSASTSRNSSGGGGNSDDGGGGSSRSSVVVFAPPDDRVLRRHDQLVLLGNRQKDCFAALVNHLPPQLPDLTTPYDGRRAMPRSIVLLEHNSRLERSMMAALEEFCAPGCQVTIVSPEPCSGLPDGPTPRAELRFRNEVGDPMSPAVLLRADVLAADAVIISGGYQLPETESDALVMGTALVLQRLLADPAADSGSSGAAATATAALGRGWGQQRRARSLPNKPLTFVCTLHDPQNRSVLQHIAATACRTAIATVAAAVSAYRPPAAIAAAGQGAGASPSAGFPAAASPLPADDMEPTFSVDFPSAGYNLQQQNGVPGSEDSSSSSSSDSVDGSDDSSYVGSSDGNSSSSGGDGGALAMGAAARGMTIEIVEPGALISGMLAQVGADPRLVSGLEDLLDEQGCEVYIKRPDRYGLKPLQRFTWSQVCEVVRCAPGGDVALGYMHRGHLHLAPPADTQLVLVAGDKLVVLSESFL